MQGLKIKWLVGVLSLILFVSCQKEQIVQYGINEVNVDKPGASKPNQKSTEQYLSIVYSDLYDKQITNNELVRLNTIVESFGDKGLVEKMIVESFLSSSNLKITSKADMVKDPTAFLNAAYKKFLGRFPSEMEKWFLTKKIKESTIVSPQLIYLSILTSVEYRKF
jgi:hypothetical protein